MKIFVSRLYFCLFLVFFTASFFLQIPAAKKEKDMLNVNKLKLTVAGVVSTLTDIKNTVKGLKKISDFVVSGLNFLGELAGIKAILLFLSVIILSSGYSVFGIPKGKALFLLSLFTSDLMWYLFIKSFPDNSFSFIIIVKTNLVVLTPFFLIYLLKKVSPLFVKKIKFLIIRNFAFIKRRAFNKSKAINLSGRLQEMSMRLNKSLTMDILSSNDKVALSRLTASNLRELENILQELRNSLQFTGNSLQGKHGSVKPDP